DQLFHRLSGVVSSETVLAHVRKATQGPKTVLNCHPFQHGRWVFAHNGDIPNFAEHREALMLEVAPRLRRFILGETDSEVVFFVFLTELSARAPLSRRHALEDVVVALRQPGARVRAICDGSDATSRASPTLMATDGDPPAAAHAGSGRRGAS